MKTHPLTAALTALLIASNTFAQEAPKPPAPRDAENTEKRRVVVVKRADGEAPGPKAEPRAWLGIEPAPVGEALAAQLGLAEGTGLLVAAVLPESPAAEAGLRQHDVLTKLDDQLLIEVRQLQVLVRNRKGGDQVKLTYIRGGREATATVTLAERVPPPPPRAPRMEWFGRDGESAMPPIPPMPPVPGMEGRTPSAPHAPRPPTQFRFETSGLPPEVIDEVMRTLGEVREGAGEAVEQARRALRSVRTVTVMDLGEGEVTVNDGEHTLRMTGPRGNRMLSVRNRGGEEVFSGPVNTEAERDALPHELRAKLRRLETEVRVDTAPAPEVERQIRVIRPASRGEPL
jgi:serine protease Do